MRTIHTIPVPVGWSPEQAWEAIRRDDLPFTHSHGEPSWANVEVDGAGRLIALLPVGEDAS